MRQIKASAADCIMKEYHIINPAAGHGRAQSACTASPGADTVLYLTKAPGDARRYLSQILKTEQDEVRVIVWGGDGTIGEAAAGIMDAGANERAVLTARAFGTGNDFVRMFAGCAPDTEYRLDLLACHNGGYIVNMLNIGFDCSVVAMTDVWKKKPFIGGSLAYIISVLDVLRRPLGTEMRVVWTDENGVSHTEEGTFLLCAAGNAQYCGGGFRGIPCASLTDGYADLMLVRTVTRRRFFGLVGRYHAGTHLDSGGNPIPSAADIISCHRCTDASFTGMRQVCCDGEVSRETEFSFHVMPGVLRYRT
ncbi:MAG: diacylglycerol/lipid kinase family protein [Eubacteriales bacterium]